MLSRPSLAELLEYRQAVEDSLVAALPSLSPEGAELVKLGLQHEQQHQELMLMDMLAAMAENPLRPAVWRPSPASTLSASQELVWVARPGGMVEIGHSSADFAFDCETPRHRVHLEPHRLADRTATNAEWLQFMSEGGYGDPLLWLADGWDWVRSNEVAAPLYWVEQDGGWQRFGLDGLRLIDPAAPVCHISFYEADAFARWAGARLPTEAEWEAAAADAAPGGGHQLDEAGPAAPRASPGEGLRDLFGNVWEWTASAYRPYPRFKPPTGTVGEYNGKFMSGQMVLRGGSCATPRGHVRASYRNFFYPHQRWMFSGVRLARDD
jgi:ergothioneine biosynthesis protein EgtB